MARLLLLAPGPHVPAGLLARRDWRTLESADRVLAADPAEPWPAALAAEGIVVETVGGTSAAERAAALVTAAARRDTVWVGSADGDPGLREAIVAEAARIDDAPEVRAVGPPPVTGARLLDAVAVVDRLRSPGGCAWVAAQDHASLAPFVLEEAHEVTEALEAVIARPDDPRLRADLTDELGDLLFQVVFHARVAADHAGAPFDVDDVAGALVDKLVRRNPHVFADATATTLEEIEAQWQAIKAVEKAERADGAAPA